ncbi:hypothetical protein BGZ93_004388 [Podila epicladia]|nr:hypothetical protein BGZ92_003421 [Podila epicladia]KAG0096513.1 hypothetical protein BGZ93_004388 [Podila epicladia]
MTPTVVLIPNYGLVQGMYDNEKQVRKFLNIPFATVHKRWHRASRVEPWTGIRDATHFGPLCPQTIDTRSQPSQIFTDMFGLPTQVGPELLYSERDCLNMAIYAPNITAPAGGFPTIVYLHGGSFKSGGNALPDQDFTNFVQTSVSVGKPVVVASVNYRLDHLGFLGSLRPRPTNALTHDQDEAFGYWGLHDQKLGFEWVRDHIHVFGGRGTDLTAMGHSSGSTSLMYHTMIPAHHGLFTRMIAHSSPTGSLATFSSPLYGQRVVDGLSKHFKVHTHAHNGEVQEQVISSTTSRRLPASAQKALSTVQVLRSIPAETLVSVDLPVGNLTTPVTLVGPGHGRPAWETSTLFQRHSLHAIRDPSRLDPGVRAMYIGTTTDETSGYVSQMGAATLSGFWRALDRLVDPSLHRRLLEVYGTPTTDAEAKRIAGEYMRDLEFWSPSSAVLQTLLHSSSSQTRVHRFYLESKVECVERQRGLGLGAFHCIDVNHSIMSDVALGYMSEQERAFGWKMVGKWIDVAWGEDGAFSFSPRDSRIHWASSDPVLLSSPLLPSPFSSSSMLSPVVLAGGVQGDNKTWQRSDGQVGLRITKQYQFRTAPFELMNRDKLELIGRNAEWVMRLHQAPPKIVSVGMPQRQVVQRVYRARL